MEGRLACMRQGAQSRGEGPIRRGWLPFRGTGFYDLSRLPFQVFLLSYENFSLGEKFSLLAVHVFWFSIFHENINIIRITRFHLTDKNNSLGAQDKLVKDVNLESLINTTIQEYLLFNG
jgi:hypothetical protein